MADLTPEQQRAADLAAIADGIKAQKDGDKKAETQRKKDQKRFNSMNKANQAEVLKIKAAADLKSERAISAEKLKTERAILVEKNKAQEEAITVEIDKGIGNSIAAQIAGEFKKAKEKTSQEADIGSLEAKLKGMKSIFYDKEANSNQKLLINEFRNVQSTLQDPNLNSLERSVAEGQLKELQQGADAEEERREKQKTVDDQNSIFKGIRDGVKGMGEKLSSVLGGMGGAGLIGVLGTAALLFSDPKTLMDKTTIAIERVKKVVQGIQDTLNGDWKDGWDGLTDSLWTTGLTIGGLGYVLRGPIGLAMSGVKGALNLLPIDFKALKVSLSSISTNMKDTVISSAKNLGIAAKNMGRNSIKAISGIGNALKASAVAAGGVMASMMSSMLAFLAPFAIPIAIALAIVAVVAAIGYALTKIRDALGFKSVWDVIWLGIMYLKDAFAHLGNFFLRIKDKIYGMINKVASLFGYDQILSPTQEFLKTDNAATFMASAKVVKLEEDAAKDLADSKTPGVLHARENAGIPGFEAIPSGATPYTDLNIEDVDLSAYLRTADPSVIAPAPTGESSLVPSSSSIGPHRGQTRWEMLKNNEKMRNEQKAIDATLAARAGIASGVDSSIMLAMQENNIKLKAERDAALAEAKRLAAIRVTDRFLRAGTNNPKHSQYNIDNSTTILKTGNEPVTNKLFRGVRRGRMTLATD